MQSTTIHRSTTRNFSLLGGDREIILLTLCVAAACIFVLMSWTAVIYSVILLLFVFPISRTLYKSDPLMKYVYRRYLNYQAYYPARQSAFRKETN